MPLTDIRQRTAVLFVAVMLGHIILISAQVNSRSGVPLLESVTFGAFAEVQRAAADVTGTVRDVWNGYVDLRGLRDENAGLKKHLGELELRLQQERAVAERARQLERLLGLKEQTKFDTVAASVIGAGPSADFRTVTLDKGTDAGIDASMAVLGAEGVIGRVVTATKHASKVQLLIDRAAAAGALIERSRAQGVIVGPDARGEAREELLRMNYVPATADVNVGDSVITSGIDGIYPKGFVIGTVAEVDDGNGVYKSIRVRPAVDFSALEEVLIVTTPPPSPDVVEGPA